MNRGIKNVKRGLTAVSVCLIVTGFGVLGYLSKDVYTVSHISKDGTAIVSEFEAGLDKSRKDSNGKKDKSEGETLSGGQDSFDLVGTLQDAFNNKDVVGYLYFPEAKISYPVVQGSTNEEYLKTDIYGNYSVSGSIFLDSDNNKDFSDTASLVYGHHMRNGTMFGSLESAIGGNPEGKQFTVYTRDSKMVYDVVAASVVEPDLRGKYLIKDKGNASEFRDVLKASGYCGKDSDDSFVTLITCHYVNRNTVRYAVTGALRSVEKYEG